MLFKKFKPILWSSLAAFVLLVILVSLGFWQLYRFHYKQTILSGYQAGLKEAPHSFSGVNQAKLVAFEHLDLQGKFMNGKTVLLDNRWHDHQLGYEVLTPLQIAGEQKAVLVNRGWVPASRSRDHLPEVPPAKPEKDIVGYVKLPDSHRFILGENISDAAHWPLRIQLVDPKSLEGLIGMKLYPFVLRLDPAEPNGFVRDWEIVNVVPERHLAYAVQWFAMAFALIIAFFMLNWKRCSA